jgi:hypothetical protein
LKLGNWNNCPPPEEHVAIWRYWDEKYGLKVYAVTDDVIEMFVSRPPQSREAVLALAREQFFYCKDIVLQGVGTLAQLAATLQNSKHWYFWWD